MHQFNRHSRDLAGARDRDIYKITGAGGRRERRGYDDRMSEEAADFADVMLDQWRRERPDLDLSPMGVFARLARLTRLVEDAAEEVFRLHGLRQGEFDVLAALRRSGAPYTMTPSELSAVLMTSRAGMTSRLDRLEAAGLVERKLDPADRRSFQIVLTEKGREVIDATLTGHAANLARLAQRLTSQDATTLNRIVRGLLGTLN